MDVRELIPRHKQDYERVEVLKNQRLEDIKPILPELLEWLQDMNWPIARDIEMIVVKFQEDLIPHLKYIFTMNDGDWKYFLLNGLIGKLPDHILETLKPDLERIKNNPTNDEKYSELNDIVEELLERL
jgi:hypothetical protein